MLRTFTTAIAGVVALGVATPAHAAPTTTEIHAILGETTIFGVPAAEYPLGPGATPGTDWTSKDRDIWHARRIEVGDTIFDAADGTKIGSLTRSVSFDWNLVALEQGEIESTARCSYTMELHHIGLGEFVGHCTGDLLAGNVVGNGDQGHQSGTYRLDDGGTPGVGPYLLDLTIRD